MGKDIIDLGVTPGDFNVHLLLIDPITVSPTFLCIYLVKVTFAITFRSYKIDVFAFFYALRKPIQNVK